MSDSPLSATPLLLLPGLICDARIWAPQVEALRGRRVVMAIDGYGEADSIGAMAEQVLAAAPTRFALAGHSMGGRVALEVIRRAPERVASLALISTGTHLPRPNEADGRFALLARGVEQGMDALIDAWLPPMVYEPNHLKPGLMDNLWRMCSDCGLDMYERQIRALLARPEVESLLSGIACPTLVATGAQDSWAPPAQHEAIAAAIRGATLTIVPDAGHMIQVEQPDALTAALASWLERV
ncbi:alpha/beta fold hydrolase [Sphingobium nicotianae]|uniref:Alpha/beta fold hydrolase n=1 Tax=Sphingobium nicotianae TaxID=2782607 RepID=A0A9X1DBF8_9SPHN|nr:alpha/beta fold hydrolase [Sphingobium nicotianae]MBT2186968.1 alpha/beta fold hydrolase [Sphingobium nicotianae]